MHQQPSTFGPVDGNQFNATSESVNGGLGSSQISAALTTAMIDQQPPTNTSKLTHQHFAVSGITVTSHPLVAGSQKERLNDTVDGVTAPNNGMDPLPKKSAEDATSQQPNDTSHAKTQEICMVDVIQQDFDAQSSTALCSLAKEIVRDIVNQIVEFFKIMKQLLLPMQQQFPPSSQGSQHLKQTLEKQEKLQRAILISFTRLSSVCSLLIDRFEISIPKNVTSQDLIPFIGPCDFMVQKQLDARDKTESLVALSREHCEKKALVYQLRTEFEVLTKSLNEVCWSISTLM